MVEIRLGTGWVWVVLGRQLQRHEECKLTAARFDADVAQA